MQECKILLPNKDISVSVQLKAFQLGYRFVSGFDWPQIDIAALSLSEDGIMKYWATLQGVTISYENHPYPEITAEEFLRD